ncbi:MAG: RHS repeat-associated core domain-containing protein, partial [Acidobacteriota bacterium]
AGTWNHREDHIHRDGQLLASWRPAEGLRFFHLDHLGTPRLITKADGRSAGLHTYFPFGEESVPNGSSERMKFTGHERDTHGTAGQGDDLDYMHARYCNPLNGRFLSVDPARESAIVESPQSWNRYAYGMGNPVKHVDPDGRIFWEVLDYASFKASQEAWVEAANNFQENPSVDTGVAAAQAFINNALDSVAILLPGVPGGAGLLNKGVQKADDIVDVVKATDSNPAGSYRPDRTLPRDEYGNAIPDVNLPHTQLGRRSSAKSGEYTQAREFGHDGEKVRDVDFTNHGRGDHPDPHQHRYDPSTGKRLRAEELRY